MCVLPGATACGSCTVCTQVPQGRIACVSDEPQSLPEPQVSGRPSHSLAFASAAVGPAIWAPGLMQIRQLGVWTVHTLAPWQTWLLVGGTGGSKKVPVDAFRTEGSSFAARPAEFIVQTHLGVVAVETHLPVFHDRLWLEDGERCDAETLSWARAFGQP